MKKRYKVNIICFVIGLLLLSMNIQVFGSTIVVTSISLNKVTDVLTTGTTDNLVATVYPLDATNQAVAWVSSNTTIVNVFSNGLVVPVSPGTAMITVTTADGSKSASCMVVVNKVAASISLNKTSDSLALYGNDTLIATVNQLVGTYQTVTWSSSDSAVVRVNNGLILAVGEGSAIVTATAVNGGSVASCYVKVSSPILSINFNKSADYLIVGGSDILTLSVNPPNATNPTVTWASSDVSIVQVNEGTLIAVSAGSAVITATTADGTKTATCNVTVNIPGTSASIVNSISLNKTSDILSVGGTDTLTATINPATATNQAITWSTSNADVASVVNGVITAISQGNSTITAISVDGYKTASCTVVVNAASPITITPPITTNNVNLVRLGGADRYQTSTAISQSGWAGTSSYAVLATGNDYPDALSAAPLAKKYSAPILLTDKNSISQSVLTELTRLKVTHVFIVGGTGVVAQAIENQLNTMAIATERLGGIDRFQTSIKIAEKLGVVSGEIMLANGLEWQDALSASSIAAKKGIPIILTNKDVLPDSINVFITKNTFTKTYILGDTDLISDNVANKLPNKERIVGSDQYERNINIIKRFESDISFSKICVATGKDFPDALSGSALAAMYSSAIVLVDDSALKDVTTQYVSGKLTGINDAYTFGLQGAVSDAAVKKLFNK